MRKQTIPPVKYQSYTYTVVGRLFIMVADPSEMYAVKFKDWQQYLFRSADGESLRHAALLRSINLVGWRIEGEGLF